MQGRPDTGTKVALTLWGWCSLSPIPHLLPSPVHLTLGLVLSVSVLALQPNPEKAHPSSAPISSSRVYPNTWLNLKGKGQGEVKPVLPPRAPRPSQPLGAWVLPNPPPPTDCECPVTQSKDREYI